jgi:hypothetical protein
MYEQFAREQGPDPNDPKDYPCKTPIPGSRPPHTAKLGSAEQGTAPSPGERADPGRPARPIRNSNPKHDPTRGDYTQY